VGEVLWHLIALAPIATAHPGMTGGLASGQKW